MALTVRLCRSLFAAVLLFASLATRVAQGDWDPRTILTPAGALVLTEGGVTLFPPDGPDGGADLVPIADIVDGRSMALSGDGVVVAGESLQCFPFPPARGEAAANASEGRQRKPRWTAALLDAAVASDGKRVYALGRDAGGNSGDSLRLLRCGATGVEGAEQTNIPGEYSVMELARSSRGWVAVLVRGKEPSSRVEVWRSKDGRAWKQAEVPPQLSEQATGLSPLNVEIDSGNDAVLVRVGTVLLASRGDEPFAQTVPPFAANTAFTGPLFAEGEFFLRAGSERIARSKDSRGWSLWGIVEERVQDVERTGVLEGRMRWVIQDKGRGVTMTTASALVATDPDPPAALTAPPPAQDAIRVATQQIKFDRSNEVLSASIPSDEKYISGVVALGDRCFMASPRGFLSSTDGRSFTLMASSPMPLAPYGIGATSDAVWVWSASSVLRGVSNTAVCVAPEPGATPRQIAVPLMIESGVCVGDTALFLGPKEKDDSASLFIAWTRDGGASWSERELPARRMKDGPAIVHGPIGSSSSGFVVLGRDDSGNPVLMRIRDPLGVDVRVEVEAISPPAPGLVKLEYRSLALSRERIAVLGSFEYGSVYPLADFLLVRSPDITTPDGRLITGEWQYLGVPLQPFTNRYCAGKSKIFSSGGVTVLSTDGEFILSRDLDAWFAVPAMVRSSLTDWGSIAPFPDQGVLFLSSVPYPGNSLTESSLHRMPLPSETECGDLIPHRLFPIAYRAYEDADDWSSHLSSWDSTMSLGDLEGGGGIDARIKATDILLQRWRQSHPGRPTDQDIAMVTNMFGRLVMRATAERTFAAIVSLSSRLNDGDRADGLTRICARLRSGKVAALADILEDIDAASRGARRKYGTAEPSFIEPQPQRAAAEFDLDLMRSRAARGDAAAAYDLMHAYEFGLGVPVDRCAVEFWGSEADRLGLTAGEGAATTSAAAKAGSTAALVEIAAGIGRKGGSEPDLDAQRELLRKARDRGSLIAMRFLANSLQFDSGTPAELSEARELLERAARAGDPLAMRALGVCYAQGVGVSRNQRIAAAYLRQAGLREDLPSMLDLASRSTFAVGVDKSDAEVDFWLNLAEQTQRKRAQWDRSATTDIAALRAELAGGVVNRFDNLYVPPRISMPHVDLAKTLAAARAGDAVACADLAQAYLSGLGVYPNHSAHVWWEQRAQELGWDRIKAIDAKTGRAAAPAMLPVRERFEGDYMAYLEKTAAAGSILAKTELGKLKLRAPAARAAAVAELLGAAQAGSGEAWLQLGIYAEKPDVQKLVGRSGVDCLELAGKSNLPRGFAVAALLLFEDSLLDQGEVGLSKKARGAADLLAAARLAEPPYIDRVKSPEAFLAASERALATAAESGDADAMVAYSIMLGFDMPGRPRDFRQSELWGFAARELGGDLVAVPGLRSSIRGWGVERSDELNELMARRFIARIVESRNGQSDDPRLAGRGARSARDRSRWSKAYAALLGQSLDDSMIKDASASAEVFAPEYAYFDHQVDLSVDLRALRTSAGAHPTLRGIDLIAAIAGVPAKTDDPAAPGMLTPLESAILRKLGVEEGDAFHEQQEVALHEQVIKLLAARRFYGLGTPIDQRAAALILARSWESDTRRFDVAFAVSELTDADLLELSRVWESNWR